LKAAAAAEKLAKSWPERLVLSVGSELTLFRRGIVSGNTLSKRLDNLSRAEAVEAGERNERLNAFLAKTMEAVRTVFHGQVTYASLPWKIVDWSRFDAVGVDHYREQSIKDRYVEMLQPLFASEKLVVITEFGNGTYQSSDASGATGLGIVDFKTLSMHHIPLLGRFVRPRLKGEYVRDETLQARELIETLGILDAAGVDGAFVFTFLTSLFPYSDNPRYDLDMGSSSLVKSFGGKHGTTYPDMGWEPKESFKAVAEYFAKQ
jgi:hypothetical protein